MPEILLDSDVIIEWLRGHAPFAQQMVALVEAHADLGWTPVSIAEILAGSQKGASRRIVVTAVPSRSYSDELGGLPCRVQTESHWP